jgi:chemotaxis protein methyltransferase CheR
MMIKYFKQDGQNWKYKPEYFANVSFDTQNLLAPFKPTQTFDMVFCRNVLIYQSLENKIQVLSKIQNVLREGGYLFLGAGESLMGLSNDFVVSNINGIVCYRKKKKADVAA